MLGELVMNVSCCRLLPSSKTPGPAFTGDVSLLEDPTGRGGKDGWGEYGR